MHLTRTPLLACRQYQAFSGPLVFAGVDGPAQWNIDGRLSKSFRIREGMNLQFRMEAYNLTNSLMFTNPDTTVTATRPLGS